MQYSIPRYNLLFRPARVVKMPLLRKLLLPTLLLLIISITTTFAQKDGNNSIFISGQIVNNVNGAPISGHPVYIESNSESNGGFNYYLAAVTDEFGFFYDTVNTHLLEGSLFIYTYDDFDEEYEKQEFFRFNWASEYYMLTGLEITDPNSSTDFQANFESHKSVQDSLFYDFSDISIGDSIISWLWDFGDGSGSVAQNPAHSYSEAGVYDVILTVSRLPFQNDIKISSIKKKVKAGMREYYNFGGLAFAGYFPVDIGTAYLYKMEEDVYVPIDTAEFDTLGTYYFYQMIGGEYIVKTFPSKSSTHAGAYLPTYYGDALFWTLAKPIVLDATAFEYDINMVSNYEYNSGNGAIDGIVSMDGGKDPFQENIEIILFNESDNCLTYIQSNKDGEFEFSGLAYGTYKVLAEVLGMYTYPSTITLDEESPAIAGISIIVYEEEITHGLGEMPETKLSKLGNPYPNPARDHTTIEFELLESNNVQIFILNQSGQVVDRNMQHFNSGRQVVQLNTANLPAGMYNIMVLLDNEKHIKPFIKVN
jgi:hypothetical protein